MTANITDALLNKVALSRIGTAILAVCALIANMPDSISNQMPQLFPEKYRGYIAPVMLIAAYVLHTYGSNVKATLTTGSSGSVQPQPGAVQPVIKP